jgi:hypothetical protein
MRIIQGGLVLQQTNQIVDFLLGSLGHWITYSEVQSCPCSDGRACIKKGQGAQTHTARTKYVKEVVGGKLSICMSPNMLESTHSVMTVISPMKQSKKGKSKYLMVLYVMGRAALGLCGLTQIIMHKKLSGERAIEVIDRTGS